MLTAGGSTELAGGAESLDGDKAVQKFPLHGAKLPIPWGKTSHRELFGLEDGQETVEQGDWGAKVSAGSVQK
jgi:hypothetical protein